MDEETSISRGGNGNGKTVAGSASGVRSEKGHGCHPECHLFLKVIKKLFFPPMRSKNHFASFVGGLLADQTGEMLRPLTHPHPPPPHCAKWNRMALLKKDPGHAQDEVG